MSGDTVQPHQEQTVMRTFIAAFIVLGTAAVAAPARAAVWEIDSSHSTAEFSVKHMMVSNVKGTFNKVTGTVNIDEKDLTKSSVDVTIDPNTIDTHEAKRDGHLKSPDFFDVAKFPTITFKSTKVEKAGKGKLKLTDDLRMHGVTKAVVLSVEGPGPEVKNAFFNAYDRGATATGKINRKDWGLTWNKPLESAGGVLVGDEVQLTIDLELIKKPEAAAPTAEAAAPKAGEKAPAKAAPAAAAK
jgi:polyisoprenoid-binding protein YceI